MDPLYLPSSGAVVETAWGDDVARAVNRCGVTLERAAAFSVAANTPTLMTWDTIVDQAGDLFAGGGATGFGPSVVTSEGLYFAHIRVDASAAWGTNANDRMILKKNGVAYCSGVPVIGGSGGVNGGILNCVVPLAASDYVQLELTAHAACTFTGWAYLYRFTI